MYRVRRTGKKKGRDVSVKSLIAAIRLKFAGKFGEKRVWCG
jgi:hypothetical protein